MSYHQGLYVDDSARGVRDHYAIARPYVSVESEIDQHTRARADSAGDGLIMKTTMDDANRPVRTFSLAPGRTKMSSWMGNFAAPAHEMLRLCQKPQTPQENAAWESRRVSAADLASGNFVLPEF